VVKHQTAHAEEKRTNIQGAKARHESSHKRANGGKKYPEKPQHFSVVWSRNSAQTHMLPKATFKQWRAGTGVYVVPLFIKNGW